MQFVDTSDISSSHKTHLNIPVHVHSSSPSTSYHLILTLILSSSTKCYHHYIVIMRPRQRKRRLPTSPPPSDDDSHDTQSDLSPSPTSVSDDSTYTLPSKRYTPPHTYDHTTQCCHCLLHHTPNPRSLHSLCPSSTLSTLSTAATMTITSHSAPSSTPPLELPEEEVMKLTYGEWLQYWWSLHRVEVVYATCTVMSSTGQ